MIDLSKVAAVYRRPADRVTEVLRRFRTIVTAPAVLTEWFGTGRVGGRDGDTIVCAAAGIGGCAILPDRRFADDGGAGARLLDAAGGGAIELRGAPLVHVHGVLFFGWAVFYVLQTALASTGSLATHRRLGWFAAVWAPAMVVMGIWVTVAMVRRGAVPFVFAPAYFLVMNPLNILTFAGLTAPGVKLRRQTQYHRRLLFAEWLR